MDLSRARRAAKDERRLYLPGLHPAASLCALFDIILAAPCFVQGLNNDFEFMSQFVRILGPIVEAALLQTNPLASDDASWCQSSTLVVDPGKATRHGPGPFARTYSQWNANSFGGASVLGVACDDGRVGRLPKPPGAAIDPAKKNPAWLMLKKTRPDRSRRNLFSKAWSV